MGRLTSVSTLKQFPTYQARFASDFPIQCPPAIIYTLTRPQLHIDSYIFTLHPSFHFFPPLGRSPLSPLLGTMCIRVVEKFPVCGCIYHVHSVDRCASYGRHPVVDRIIWVGASCPDHGGQSHWTVPIGRTGSVDSYPHLPTTPTTNMSLFIRGTRFK
ncbi:hypothetical protein P3342_002974 [Pyrenophora teres f. teres]|nr:hypothetical protein P3342_002974 [Pyrenophora teres f. teres]